MGSVTKEHLKVIGRWHLVQRDLCGNFRGCFPGVTPRSRYGSVQWSCCSRYYSHVVRRIFDDRSLSRTPMAALSVVKWPGVNSTPDPFGFLSTRKICGATVNRPARSGGYASIE